MQYFLVSLLHLTRADEFIKLAIEINLVFNRSYETITHFEVGVVLNDKTAYGVDRCSNH